MISLHQELQDVVLKKREVFNNSELINKYEEMKKLGIVKPRENTLSDISDKQKVRLKNNSMEQKIKHGIEL